MNGGGYRTQDGKGQKKKTELKLNLTAGDGRKGRNGDELTKSPRTESLQTYVGKSGEICDRIIPAPIIESKEEIVHTPSPGLVQEIQYLRSESRTTRLPRTVSDAVLQLDSSGNAGSLCSLASGRVLGEKGFDMKGSQTRRSSPIEPASTLCCGVLTSEC